jgi:hypothetical protein
MPFSTLRLRRMKKGMVPIEECKFFFDGLQTCKARWISFPIKL